MSLEQPQSPTVSAPVPVPLHAPPPRREAAPKAPEATPVEAPVQHDSSARVAVPVVVGALAVAALGVGIGMGVASQGKESDATSFRASNATGFCADRSSTTCAQYQGILNSQQTDTTVSRAFLISGGVLAVGAIVTYLVWPHHGKERAAWFAPFIEPARHGAPSGGAAFGGQF